MSAIPATPTFEDETRAASPAAGLHPALPTTRAKNHPPPRDDVPEKTTTTCLFSSDEEPVGSTTPSNAEAPAPKSRQARRPPKSVRDAIKAGAAAAAASRVRSPYSPDPEATAVAEKSTGRGWENDSTAGTEIRTAETDDATGNSTGKFITESCDDWNLSHGRGSNTSKPAASMSRAGGLEVRVDRPGDARRAAAEASRAREFGPKARWTCRVQRSPPKRGDETSRDRLPPRLRYAPRVRSPDDDDDGGSEPSLAPSSDGSDDDDDGWGPCVGLARKRHQSFNAVATAAALSAAHAAFKALGDSEETTPETRGEEDFPAPRAEEEEEEERVADARATSTERVARQRTRERTRSRSPIRQIRVDAPRDTRRGASPPRSRFDRGREVSPRRVSPGRVTRGRERWSPPRDRRYDRDARRRPSRSRSPSPRRRRPSSWSPSRERRNREDDDTRYFPHREDDWNPAYWNRDPYASPPRVSPIERTCTSDPRKATSSSGLLEPRREERYPTPPTRSASPTGPGWSTRPFSTVEAAAVQQTTGVPMKFKWKLCEDWMRHGRCPAGDVCGYAHGASQLRDSVVPGFDPTNESHVRAHTYRACVHTALCHVSRCCVWVDQFQEVFRYVWNTDLELPVRFGGVPYSMEEYLVRFMSPHTVRVFEHDGRAAVTLATPNAFDEARRRDDDDDAFGLRRGVRGDGRENERPTASSDRDRRRSNLDFFSADEERPRKKPRAIVVDRREDAWFIDTDGNNGLVIGAKGKAIKAMESQSGASIDANSKEHVVKITGRPEAVRSARLMIEHKLGEFHKDFIGAATMRDLDAARRREADRSTGARQLPPRQLPPRQSPAADRGEDSRDSVTEPCATPIDNEQSPSRQERQSPMKPPAADYACNACGLRFVDEKELRAHKSTEGHLSSVRAAAGFYSPKTLEYRRPKCELCGVTCTSNMNLQMHYEGKKHKEMLARREAQDRKKKAEDWKKKNSR